MKQLLLILITLAFLGILVGSNIYLSKRFAWYFNLEHTGPLYFLIAGLTLFMIVGVIAFSNSTSLPGHLLYVAASFFMGFLLYLLLSVLFTDLLHFVLKMQPQTYGLTALLLAIFISGFSIFNAFQVKTTKIEVGIKGLKEEVRVMHFTDIHLGHFRGEKFMQGLVDRTLSQDVEAVLLTGDLFDGRMRFFDKSLEPLKQLKVPIYFVEGNHDGYSGIKHIKSSLREIGVRVLENETADMGEIQIIGLNHMQADSNTNDMHAAGSEHATIKSILPGIQTDPNKPTILLHHSPDGIQYAAAKGVDLYLAGHTHGGQLFPVNLIGNLLFRYNKGLHDYEGTKIYVSTGAGTFGPPMRLGTRSEITLVTLKPE